LDEIHEVRLSALVGLLRHTHREAEVGVSPRTRVWSVTGAVLRFLWNDLPSGALEWAKVLAILEAIKWLSLSSELQAIISS
jgi:hypothetical protein